LHQSQAIAQFAQGATLQEMTDRALDRLKLHVLDTLGCAIGALGSGPLRAVGAQIDELGSSGRCTCIGRGTAAPDRAALWNGALVRYVDFMDNYLAPRQTCHPSDTFASVLAAAEYADCSSEEFLTALAVAYQVFCRLIDESPVQEHGFDHTVQLAYAIAAGTSRALGLDVERTAHAVAIAGASVQGLVVTRADYLSQWKGLQSAHVALACTNAVFLARHGITGPLQILDGKEGFPKAFGRKVEIDWAHENLERILHASLKSYNAEVHTQPVLEVILALRREHKIAVDRITRVEVEVFKQAYDITGSGEEAGNKYDVRSKEQADHSLPYLAAVALLDGEVTPRQFTPERIGRADVQALLRRVRTLRDDQYTQRYPDETPCRVVIEFVDGRQVSKEQSDWAGFFKRPLDWPQVRAKFYDLAEPHADISMCDRIAETVAELERRPLMDLTRLLGAVSESTRVSAWS
jgi:2-methylcitrate dehydratase